MLLPDVHAVTSDERKCNLENSLLSQDHKTIYSALKTAKNVVMICKMIISKVFLRVLLEWGGCENKWSVQLLNVPVVTKQNSNSIFQIICQIQSIVV